MRKVIIIDKKFANKSQEKELMERLRILVNEWALMCYDENKKNKITVHWEIDSHTFDLSSL